MVFRIKHISLVIGMLTVIFSFLFFGRNTPLYDNLLIAGLLIAVISYAAIILGKGSAKIKLLWTLIVIAGIGIQWVSQDVLVRASFLIYYKKNEKTLEQLNSIFLADSKEKSWSPNPALWSHNGIDDSTGRLIQGLAQKAKVLDIWKDDMRVYYRLWGMLDISHGVAYYYTNYKPEMRPLKGNWYY